MEVASNIIPADTGDVFGISYSSWKGRGSNSLGEISGRDRAIYTRKLCVVRKIMSVDIRNVLEICFGQGGFMADCRERGWRATRPEARLGFDGGLAKGIHKLIAGRIISIFGWVTKAIYFQLSRMVLTGANVIACLRQIKSEDSGVG